MNLNLIVKIVICGRNYPPLLNISSFSNYPNLCIKSINGLVHVSLGWLIVLQNKFANKFQKNWYFHILYKSFSDLGGKKKIKKLFLPKMCYCSSLTGKYLEAYFTDLIRSADHLCFIQKLKIEIDYHSSIIIKAEIHSKSLREL